MNKHSRAVRFERLLLKRPDAWAILRGDSRHPRLYGEVGFYETPYGVLVAAEVLGLTNAETDAPPSFGFHIHEGDGCTGDGFADTRMHYNPKNRPHPYHSGDMPPLFGANGYAYNVFLTDRFTVGEVIGKTVVVHSSPDDFTSQPSGNAGTKIACGVIHRSER